MSETNQTTGPAGRQRRTRGKGRRVLIVAGLFFPVAAVIGYFGIALYLSIPVHSPWGQHRHS